MNFIELSATGGAGFRLDKFLKDQLHDLSRTQIQEMIRNEQVLVNGTKVKPSFLLEGTESIAYSIPEPKGIPATLIPQNIPLDILYEDEFLVAVNKQARLTVHPGVGQPEGTLVNGLVYHFQSLSDVNGTLRPGIVHRLDADTTGVILIAKTNIAHRKLAEQFEKRIVQKVYEGITWGVWIEDEGTVNAPILRKRTDPRSFTVSKKGKVSITDYRVQFQSRYLSHVEFYPKSGRTHQIRVHAASVNHPIFADEKYGGGIGRTKGFLPEVTRLLKKLHKEMGRHALHARRLTFHHPVSGDVMSLEAPIPDDLQKLIRSLETMNG